MSNTVQGTQSPVEGPTRYGYQPGRGSYLVRTWRCSTASSAATLATSLAASGYSYEVSPSGDGAVTIVEGKLDAEANTPNPETTVLSEIWERDVYMTEKDLLESNHTLVSTGSISNAERDTLRAAVQNPREYVFTTALGANAATVFNLYASGVKSTRVFSPIIRRTRIVANNYTVQNSDANVGRILSSSQMTSLEGCPATVLFALPGTESANGRVPFIAGFYKKPARVVQQGDGKWQIVQEYEYDLWASALYSAAS